MNAALVTTSIAQLQNAIPIKGPLATALFNQFAGHIATQIGYKDIEI